MNLLLFIKHCETHITGYFGDVRLHHWIHISGGVMGKKRSTLHSSEEQNERDEGKSATRQRPEMAKREQWVCAIWNQYCWEQPFARRDSSAGRLSALRYDVFIYLFTVQVPKWISKLIMKFEIPHWDTKNCWGKSTFLSTTPHAVLVRAQNILLRLSCHRRCSKNRTIWLPLSEIRCQNLSNNHSISDTANQDESLT